jgi:nitrite reductase/ring-hydroxylating ferredoxin subunit
MPDRLASHAASAPKPAGAERNGLALCDSGALRDGGTARLFDIHLWGEPARGFALRHDGQVVAYVNRCAHVPAEMDWLPGEFLDSQGRHIICSIHGAEYEPGSGRCVGGPCGRGSLIAIEVAELEGRVYWYPSLDIRPPQMAVIPFSAPSDGSAPAST